MISHRFKRNSKRRTNSATYLLLKLIQHIQVATRSTVLDITAFHAESNGRFIKIRSNFEKGNFIEQISVPLFLRKFQQLR